MLITEHLRTKTAKFLKTSSSYKVTLRKKQKPVLELPLAAGIGVVSAAILLHAPITAIAAIAALSSDFKVSIQKSSPLEESNDLKDKISQD